MAAAPTGTVTVEWNYAITATITMYTQTTASQTHNPTATAGKIYWASDPAGSTSSECNGSESQTTDASANATVNYGTVVADGTDYTNCLETNAIDAYIVTNDSSGANLTVSEAGAPSDYDTASNGSLLCILPDGTWSTTGNTAWTTSARSAAVSMASTTACSSGTAVTAAAANILALTKSTTGSDLNSDLQLNMGPQMQSGSQTLTLTYTFTTN
jgi:hypothetical protein